jgi:hypothetical protein
MQVPAGFVSRKLRAHRCFQLLAGSDLLAREGLRRSVRWRAALFSGATQVSGATQGIDT